uniref:Uncharacterized protein n=1 Tax=Timema douglasi TaxID=61478 RepID=A0A7R8VTV1_TIMDO|nr:unnamed protein product [Timema douglasi]
MIGRARIFSFFASYAMMAQGMTRRHNCEHGTLCHMSRCGHFGCTLAQEDCSCTNWSHWLQLGVSNHSSELSRWSHRTKKNLCWKMDKLAHSLNTLARTHTSTYSDNFNLDDPIAITDHFICGELSLEHPAENRTWSSPSHDRLDALYHEITGACDIMCLGVRDARIRYVCSAYRRHVHDLHMTEAIISQMLDECEIHWSCTAALVREVVRVGARRGAARWGYPELADRAIKFLMLFQQHICDQVFNALFFRDKYLSRQNVDTELRLKLDSYPTAALEMTAIGRILAVLTVYHRGLWYSGTLVGLHLTVSRPRRIVVIASGCWQGGPGFGSRLVPGSFSGDTEVPGSIPRTSRFFCESVDLERDQTQTREEIVELIE